MTWRVPGSCSALVRSATSARSTGTQVAGRCGPRPPRVGEKILAVGSDIYRTGKSERNVLVLAASLAPGDSGGAVVDGDGTVIGVAFAVDPGQEGISYAVTDAEVRAVLETRRRPPR